MNRSSTCERAAISAATALLRFDLFAELCPVWVRYVKEFCSKALSDLKYSTRVNFWCSAASGLRVLAHFLCRLARYCRALGAQRIRYPGELCPIRGNES